MSHEGKSGHLSQEILWRTDDPTESLNSCNTMLYVADYARSSEVGSIVYKTSAMSLISVLVKYLDLPQQRANFSEPLVRLYRTQLKAGE